ncbi:Mobile element protein, partial [uncultured Leptolyngbya sp.]
GSPNPRCFGRSCQRRLGFSEAKRHQELVCPLLLLYPHM